MKSNLENAEGKLFIQANSDAVTASWITIVILDHDRLIVTGHTCPKTGANRLVAALRKILQSALVVSGSDLSRFPTNLLHCRFRLFGPTLPLVSMHKV